MQGTLPRQPLPQSISTSELGAGSVEGGREKEKEVFYDINYVLNMVDFYTDALTLCKACNTRSVMLAQLVWSQDPEVSTLTITLP